MNPESLQPRERRILALGLLLGALLVLVLGIVKPVIDRYSLYQHAIEDLTLRIERLGGVAKTAPELGRRVDALSDAVRTSGLTLERETPALAAADMQRRLSDLVTEHGGEVRSTQMVPSVSEEGFTRVAIRVQMNGDSAVLAGILESVESERPLVFLDSIRVRALQQRVFPRRAVNLTPTESVDVQFDAVVFMRPSGGEG